MEQGKEAARNLGQQMSITRTYSDELKNCGAFRHFSQRNNNITRGESPPPFQKCNCLTKLLSICRVGSDGGMSVSGPPGPGFDPRWGSKFSFENFQPRG